MHWVRGRVTRQAHVAIPDGTHEEEFARRGFFGRTSHLYRRHSPCSWTRIEGDLRPAALKHNPVAGDWIESRTALLANDDVRISLARLETRMPYAFRNGDADELLFVNTGGGFLDTDFGALEFRSGDYLLLPRGAAYRLTPEKPATFLIVESRDELEIPDRGPLGRHALFDLDVLEVPTPREAPSDELGEYLLKVQRNAAITTIVYPHDPFDVVGWKGDLAPVRLAMDDIRPVVSERYHLPPSAHTTFLARSVVICTFAPRGLEVGDEAAMRVPFFHSNIDFDEVIFYHDGDFFSRAGITPGMLTFHPQGIHHGPQPQAVEASRHKTRTEEKAVMIDTRQPLSLTEAGKRACVPNYEQSWTQVKK
jgi:homogentisate 1,2-dioxygenase